MKTIINLFALSLLFCSCEHSNSQHESEKVISETEKLQEANERIEHDLSYEKEKIILLSEARKISFDTVTLILRDYFVITDTVSSSDQNSKLVYQSSIAKISERYKISKTKVAALIFSYKYEMLTKEEIGESAVEDFQDDSYVEPPE